MGELVFVVGSLWDEVVPVEVMSLADWSDVLTGAGLSPVAR